MRIFFKALGKVLLRGLCLTILMLVVFGIIIGLISLIGTYPWVVPLIAGGACIIWCVKEEMDRLHREEKRK